MIFTQFSPLFRVTVLPCFLTLILPLSVRAEILGGNGNADVFILKVNAATHNINQAQVITHFDWFNDGDKIGLTNGLTEADLDYQELIDFDEDGFLDDTVIKLKSNQTILGIVLNADDFVLEGEFIPVASTGQPLSCLQKFNLTNCNSLSPN